MRKLIRKLARSGQDSDAWPVVLVLFAVLIPAVCLLWFMREAMRNERFAVRQKLADAYRGQLSSAQGQLERLWTQWAADLEDLARTGPVSAAFAKCVQPGQVDSVILLDEMDQIMYPNRPLGVEKTPASELHPKWGEAGQLEYRRKDFAKAALAYHELATATTNVTLAARALQAEARCLLEAGQKDAAIRLIDEVLAADRYADAADLQGRLIVANAELMELELIGDPNSTLFQSAASRLRQRLMDYESPVLAASQRRFLIKALRTLSPKMDFPTLAAEELAAQYQEKRPVLAGDADVQRAPLTEMWQFTTPNRRVIALISSAKLLARMHALAAPDNLPPDAEFAVVPPGTENDSALVTLPAGRRWPGWRLAITFKNPQLFVSATEHRIGLYLWTGLLVVGAMGVLTLLAIRFLRRQAALARMKNDLAATVSHELKTPLASMRVLVDTLLEAPEWDEKRVREYLQLITQENERLSRLIQNFLAFSRMQRTRQAFHFAPVQVRLIIDAAVQAVRERFESSGCSLEVQVQADLPAVMADADAMATALINLLDNAWKYSKDSKEIVLQARAEKQNVLFSVRDNGLGIAPRERKNIFRPFYQVDQRLSRQGSGCGLGLSIVEFIATAHHGSTSVESQPGRGSTFTICLPASPCTSTNGQKGLFR